METISIITKTENAQQTTKFRKATYTLFDKNENKKKT